MTYTDYSGTRNNGSSGSREAAHASGNADKFRIFQSNGSSWLPGPASAGGEGGPLLVYRKDAVVGDCDLMGIPSEIFDRIPVPMEGLLNKRAPVFLIECIQEFLPIVRIAEHPAGAGKRKSPLKAELFEPGQEFSLPFLTQDINREEEMLLHFPDFTVRCQAAAGNNAVHMDMIVHLLVPGMEDLDDAGDSPEIFYICRKLQKGLCAAFMKKAV